MCGRISASLGFIVLLVFGTYPAAGQSIESRRRDLAAAQAQATRATRIAATLEARAKAELGAARSAEVQSAALAARIQKLEADQGAGAARLLLIEKLREDVRARLAARQRPAIKLLAAVQSYARRPTALAVLQPGSLRDLVHIQLILAQMTPEIRKRTAHLQRDLARKRALEVDARATLQRIAQNKVQLATAQAALARLEGAHRAAARRYADSAMAAQDQALSLAEKSRDIGDLVARLSADSARLSHLAALPGPVLRPMQPGGGGQPPAPSPSLSVTHLPYRLPVTGKLVAGLGELAASGARAKGLTFETQLGAQIVAPRRGRVVFAGPFRGYGQIVILDHGSGWTSLITNMAVLGVRVGQYVGDGAPIGRAGQGAPRVIVELRQGTQPIDITRLVS